MKTIIMLAVFCAPLVSGLFFSPTIAAAEGTNPVLPNNGRQESAIETPWVGVTETDLGTNIFICTANGCRTLVSGWDNMSPSLSPDGNMVVFVSDRPDESRPLAIPPADGGYEVWVARTDGSGLRRLTSMGRFAAAPCFSNDGRWVYFSSSEEGLNFKPAEIMRVSITAIRGPEPVLKAPEKKEFPKTRLSTPKISRNGSRLYFTMSEIPYEGAMSYSFMAVFSVDLPAEGGRANLDDADKIAGGSTSFNEEGKVLGTMASAPGVAADGRVTYVSYAGRTETSIVASDGRTAETLLQAGDRIHVSPSISPSGATMIYGAMTEGAVVWIARNMATGTEVPVQVPAAGVEGRLLQAGY